MNAVLTPSSVEELAAVVRAHPRMLAVGARTKPRLSRVSDDVTLVSTASLRGVTEYDPGEFTLTALAGTPVREITATLADQGQCLPFDPVWLEAGSTLGGAVAAGVNGAGRLRYGGLRDFILGVRFIDGAGRALRVGGKVVKNAAGFDLPKFFVGSLGRFGVLTEITFKVFPRPPATLTLSLRAADPAAAVSLMTAAASARWECHALEYSPAASAVHLRLGGPAAALDPLAREILARWPGQMLTAPEAEQLWAGLREFRWAPADEALFKVAIIPAHVEKFFHLNRELPGSRLQVGAGGNVAYVSLPGRDGRPARPGSLDAQSVGTDAQGRPSLPRYRHAPPAGGAVEELDGILRGWGLVAVALRGDAPLWIGARPQPQITAAVKHALDPENRFPSLSD